VTDNASCLMER